MEWCNNGLSCVQSFPQYSRDVDSCGFVYLGLKLWEEILFLCRDSDFSLLLTSSNVTVVLLCGVLSCFVLCAKNIRTGSQHWESPHHPSLAFIKGKNPLLSIFLPGKALKAVAYLVGGWEEWASCYVPPGSGKGFTLKALASKVSACTRVQTNVLTPVGS